jgi:hypothetical protein
VNESVSALSAWESFYVIVGSSGGALIGLQFVVLTLIADRRNGATTAASVSAFGTPTVVHFGAALVISALMSVPWPSLHALSAALGVCGLIGLGYGAFVIRRARSQTGYEPVWQDWLWYSVFPAISYAALTATAVLLRSYPRSALFVVGATALSLLLIGLHNAWDAVTHIVVSGSAGNEKKIG